MRREADGLSAKVQQAAAAGLPKANLQERASCQHKGSAGQQWKRCRECWLQEAANRLQTTGAWHALQPCTKHARTAVLSGRARRLAAHQRLVLSNADGWHLLCCIGLHPHAPA